MKWVSLRRLLTPPVGRPEHDRLFVDSDGTLKKVSPDGTVATIGSGGGVAPPSREEWSDGGAAIADVDGAWMPWVSSTGPDAVLDNSVPT